MNCMIVILNAFNWRYVYIFIRNLCICLYMQPYMSLATRRKYDYVQTFALLAIPMEVHFASQHALFLSLSPWASSKIINNR